MVRVTLFYDLGPFLDEDAFYAWHAGLLLRACSVDSAETLGRVDRVPTISGGPVRRDLSAEHSVPRGFVTTLDWSDETSFREVFYGPAFQGTLQRIEAIARSSLVLLSHRVA